MRPLALVLLFLAACSPDPDGDGFREGVDCLPEDPSGHPGAPDPFGDGIDSNCDGIDGVDSDGDGFPAGTDTGEGLFDCNDLEPTAHPDGVEIAGNGIDEDCDGVDDVDVDQDGTWSADDCDDEDPERSAVDADADGVTTCDDVPDCDDNDPSLNPLDLDADGSTTCDPEPDCDDNDPTRDSLDADGDGSTTCDPEPDCDDHDPQRNYNDLDNDGFVTCGSLADCDDTDNAVRPLDEDGDGSSTCDLIPDCDDSNPALSTTDNDGDGVTTCDIIPDCDDDNPLLNPLDLDADGASTCDAIPDCDDTDHTASVADLDGDGFTTCDPIPDCDDDDPTRNLADLDDDGVTTCDAIPDCDDTDRTLNPSDVDGDGASTCDLVPDCDDHDAARSTADSDGDGESTCDPVPDCDDNDPARNHADLDGDGASTCDPIPDCDDVDAGRSVADLDGDGATTCDATPDCDDLDSRLNLADLDGDGSTTCDSVPDCDDTNSSRSPLDLDADGASTCDLVPDCDDDDPALNTRDDDGDGVTTCDATPDCDDDNAALNPLDEDRDGSSTCDLVPDCDDDDRLLNQSDVDGDGHTTCDAEPDCNDHDAATFPDAPELCDALDNDCSGAPGADEVDGDGDGALACADCDDDNNMVVGTDDDHDGYTSCAGDCDDNDPGSNPGLNDAWGDGRDTNCDGVDGLDVDGDGFAVDDGVTPDCDDADPATYPGAPDPCDGLDSNCTDDPLDVDSDGDGYALCALDCDDDDPAATPEDADGDGASTCDTVPDCDDDDAALNVDDVDGDGFSTCGGDCNDDNPTTFPHAPELCDGIDNDCDGAVGGRALFEVSPGSDWEDPRNGILGNIFQVLRPAVLERLSFTYRAEVGATITFLMYDRAAYPEPWQLVQSAATTSTVGTEVEQISPVLDWDLPADRQVLLAVHTTGDVRMEMAEPTLPIEVPFGELLSAYLRYDDFASPPATLTDTFLSQYGAAPTRISVSLGEADSDGDGYRACNECNDGNADVSPLDVDGDGLSGCSGDCDDTDPTILPGLDDPLDGTDHDCDGLDSANAESSAVAILEGHAAHLALGADVTVLPDYDGDGIDELYVGAPGRAYLVGTEGRLMIFDGAEVQAGGTFGITDAVHSITGLGVSASSPFGNTVAALPDLDGDGLRELASYGPLQGIVSGRYYNLLVYASSSVTLGGTTRDWTDHDLELPSFHGDFWTGLDVDGDNLEDVLYGQGGDGWISTGADLAAAWQRGTGVVDVSHYIDGDFNSGNDLRDGSRPVSDLDGDGYPEVLIASRSTVSGSYGPGSITLAFSSQILPTSRCYLTGTLRNCARVVVEGTASQSVLQVVELGDLDGDGLTDLAMAVSTGDLPGLPADDDRGFIALFSGATLLGTSSGAILTVEDADARIYGVHPGEAFPGTISNLGDLDGDGYVEISAHRTEQTARGDTYAIALYDGARIASALTALPYAVDSDDAFAAYSSPQRFDGFGYPRVTAIDLDHDGQRELLVPSPWYDAGELESVGRVYVLPLPSP